MSTSERRVLVVDNDQGTSLLIKHILSDVFAVDTAAHYGEVSGLLEAHPSSYVFVLIGLVLNDYKTGIDVLEAIRLRPAYYELPAIALTATDTHHHRSFVRRMGFDAILLKPFNKDRLIETVRSVLRKRHAQP
jgi:DNA-binding response OmpR family regulator